MPLLNCIVADCKNKSRSSGKNKVKTNSSAYCQKHYFRLRTTGTIHNSKNFNFGVGKTPEERFWSRLAITANPEKCWEWQAHKTKEGYGKVMYKGTRWLTHRLSWFLTFGFINDDLFIRHFVCNNPACANPFHLREGTHQDNMNDMKISGRSKTCGARKEI